MGEQINLSLEGKVKALVELGFSEFDARNSLVFFDGDIKKTLEFIPDLRKRKEKEIAKPKKKIVLSEEENLWKNDSFLLNFYNYINYRFLTCPTHCLICDDDLDVSQYKLPVCSQPECVNTFESTSCGRGTLTKELRK